MSETRARALTAIAYLQPLTRTKPRQILRRDISRDSLASLRDLPDTEKLEDEGLLSKDALLSGELASAFGIDAEEPDEIE